MSSWNRLLGPLALGALQTSCEKLDCQQPDPGEIEGNSITHGEYCGTMVPSTYHELSIFSLVAPAGNEPWNYEWTVPEGYSIVGPKDDEVLWVRVGDEPGEICVRQYVSCGEAIRCAPVDLVDQDVFAGQQLGALAARAWAVGFGLDDAVYVGGGSGYDGLYDDWWRYDPIEDAWERLGDVPGLGGDENSPGAGMALDGAGYVYTTVFQHYEPSTDSWTQLTPVLGFAGQAPSTGWAIDGGVFVCLSEQLHRYDVAGQTWTRLSDCPTGAQVATVQDDRVFVGANGAFEYDVAADSWTELEGAEMKVQILFHLNGRLYAGSYDTGLKTWEDGVWTALDTSTPCPWSWALPETGMFVTEAAERAILMGGKNGNSDFEPYKAWVTHFLPRDP